MAVGWKATAVGGGGDQRLPESITDGGWRVTNGACMGKMALMVEPAAVGG